MSSGGPMRKKDSLADVVEMLLDKGIVVNADIIVTIGETELLGIHLRAAIASFETAAAYGLEFPDGTDTERINELTGRRNSLGTIRATGGEPDIIDEDNETATWTVRPPVAVPDDETELATPKATAGESESDSNDSDDSDDSSNSSGSADSSDDGNSESETESESDSQSTEEADGSD